MSRSLPGSGVLPSIEHGLTAGFLQRGLAPLLTIAQSKQRAYAWNKRLWLVLEMRSNVNACIPSLTKS